MLAAVQQNSVGGASNTSGYVPRMSAVDNNIFATGVIASDNEDKASAIELEVSERGIDEERERMTPAFNNRVRADSLRNL